MTNHITKIIFSYDEIPDSLTKEEFMKILQMGNFYELDYNGCTIHYNLEAKNFDLYVQRSTEKLLSGVSSGSIVDYFFPNI